METVIAIGVIAVLLTGFVAVFAPAAEGIRRSLNVQEIDRLASTLERELVTLRDGQTPNSAKTGFDKAFDWIAKSNTAADALFVYQYRGNPSNLRSDGTAREYTASGGVPGKDYILQPMVRRNSDPLFADDVKAIEGGVYVVKCVQLISSGGELKSGTAGRIADPKTGTAVADPDSYPEAAIAFSAEFYSLPSRDVAYLKGSAFSQRFNNLKSPVFTRNMAVRR